MRVALLAALVGVAVGSSSSSTGPGQSSSSSSTGPGPIMSSSSTGGGGGSSSSTGPGPTPPMACDDYDSCTSCFGNTACSWCYTMVPSGNSTSKCMNTADMDTCPEMSPELKPLGPLGVLDLQTYRASACELDECVADLNMHAVRLDKLASDLITASISCVGDYYTCMNDEDKDECDFVCDFKGVDEYTSGCSNITGTVCDYYYKQADTTMGFHNGTNSTTTKAYSMTVPYCIPDSCGSKASWSTAFVDAEKARVQAECGKNPLFPAWHENDTCVSVDANVACANSPSAGDDGLSTGAVIAIVLGSLVGLALLFYFGQQMCKSQKSEYEAF